MYKFYITLLDGFQRYLQSEDDNALQEFLDKVNRVPFFSEAADKGSAFNDLVNVVLHDQEKASRIITDQEYINYTYERRDGTKADYSFKRSIVLEFADKLDGSMSEVYTEAILPTSYGDVLLYGYIDELKANKATDIKTTGNYTFPKFLKAWQHRGYSYCLAENGIQIDSFEYLITDFNNTYVEGFTPQIDRYTNELRNICERLIEFLEANKDKITDKKIFSL